MPEQFRPLPEDPSAEMVAAMFDATAENWILSRAGDYQTAAVETMQADGSAHQRLIALEWPGRPNHTDEQVTVRVLMRPDDALGLAEVLTHTARWMQAAERMAN